MSLRQKCLEKAHLTGTSQKTCHCRKIDMCPTGLWATISGILNQAWLLWVKPNYLYLEYWHNPVFTRTFYWCADGIFL